MRISVRDVGAAKVVEVEGEVLLTVETMGITTVTTLIIAAVVTTIAEIMEILMTTAIRRDLPQQVIRGQLTQGKEEISSPVEE